MIGDIEFLRKPENPVYLHELLRTRQFDLASFTTAHFLQLGITGNEISVNNSDNALADLHSSTNILLRFIKTKLRFPSCTNLIPVYHLAKLINKK